MARIPDYNDENHLTIRAWLGMNESPDSDTVLKNGELAVMRNFKVTDGGALQKRSGTKISIDFFGEGVARSPVRGLWSGYVNGVECMVAACGGKLWKITGNDADLLKAEIGDMATDGDVFIFGFSGKVYCMNGSQYKCWDGNTLSDVVGYIPIIATATPPSGGGTTLEQINKLNGFRRQKFSADGSSTIYQLAEKNIGAVTEVKVSGVVVSNYTTDTANGKVTFAAAPVSGVNNVLVTYRVGAAPYGTSDREKVLAMRYAEMYSGATDARIFLYGDGSNQSFYSGIDENGDQRADYFPDLNVMSVGDKNTPITSMVRHYARLLCFKLDSTWTISYDTIQLVDNTTTVGFYVTPVNRLIGNCAMGQARLVENSPFSFDGVSIYQWKATSTSGNITMDQRNAVRVSGKLYGTLSAAMDLDKSKSFYDKVHHEYYLVLNNGTALVCNTSNGCWYKYTNFYANCMVLYGDELYIGSTGGTVLHMSQRYHGDCGEAIDLYAETGYMDLGRSWSYKDSDEVWIGMKPDGGSYIDISVKAGEAGSCGKKSIFFQSFDFGKVNFADWLFNVTKPAARRLRMKIHHCIYYKIVFSSKTALYTATILSADIRFRYSGTVK